MANSHDTPLDPGDAADQGSPALLQALWRRKSLFLLGGVLGLVLGGIYYAQARPIYESKAQVLVVQKRPDAVTGVDTKRLSVEDYVSTQQVLIKSQLIIERAIRKRNLGSLQLFAEEQDDLVAFVEKNLSVTRNRGPSGNNNVLDLAYRGKVAEECGVVLEAIIESYKDFLDETYRNMSDDTLDLVTQARNALQTDLAQKEKAYLEFRRNAPLLSRGREGRSLYEDRLASIAGRRAALLLRRAEIQAQLKAVEKARKDGLGRDALLALVTDFAAKAEGPNGKPPAASLQEQLYPLLAEEQRLLERLGEGHPSVVSIRKRIEITRSFFASPSAPYQDLAGSPAGKGASRPADPVEAHVAYLRQQLEYVQGSERLLNEMFDSEHTDVRKMTIYEIEDANHQAAIAHTQDLVKNLIKRVSDVGLVKVVGGYDAKTIASPGLGKKVSPKVLLVFPFAGALGALLGAGLAYLAELTDKSFRGVEDVRRQLGLPVVGSIPHLQPAEASAASALDPLLCTCHQPRSLDAEAYRGVRTALYFNTRGEAHRVIQVTSPVSGDGKSTLAANLAVSIAQSGKRVLLIDADLRRPRVHKIFGVNAPAGLSSMVVGEAGPEAVRPSGVPGLSVLCAGPLPPNPAELLTSPSFKEVLDTLREQYDFVLIDTPPLLAVSDPSVVAPRVDGVILTIRIVKNGRPAGERAREILRGLGATVVGVVVNGIDRGGHSGAYGYGNYGYEYAEGGPAERGLRRDSAAGVSPPHVLGKPS